jgi:hypothetical protein
MGCDFKQWIDYYMILSDESHVAFLKKMGVREVRQAASSHIYSTVFFPFPKASLGVDQILLD